MRRRRRLHLALARMTADLRATWREMIKLLSGNGDSWCHHISTNGESEKKKDDVRSKCLCSFESSSFFFMWHSLQIVMQDRAYQTVIFYDFINWQQ